jgi:hypothetical protein
MDGMIEETLVRLADRDRSRVFGKYRGTVMTVTDSDNLCRITALVPPVYGDQESPPAYPCFPFAGPSHGMVLMPEPGDGVWIEFEAGDISRPIWSGCWFANGQHPGESKTAKERVLIATTAGDRIVVDEEKGEIRLVHSGGAKIVLSAEGITLSNGPSSTIAVQSSEVAINKGMVKVTTAGASLVNDSFKVGA